MRNYGIRGEQGSHGNSDERAQNIKGAFRVSCPEAISGKNLLVIDDVYTTGSTMNECSRILKKAGARSITVAVLAQPV